MGSVRTLHGALQGCTVPRGADAITYMLMLTRALGVVRIGDQGGVAYMSQFMFCAICLQARRRHVRRHWKEGEAGLVSGLILGLTPRSRQRLPHERFAVLRKISRKLRVEVNDL